MLCTERSAVLCDPVRRLHTAMLKCRIKVCEQSELKSSSGRSPEPRRGQWIVNTLLPGALGLPPCWYRRRSQRWQLQGPVTGLAEGGQLPAVPRTPGPPTASPLLRPASQHHPPGAPGKRDSRALPDPTPVPL